MGKDYKYKFATKEDNQFNDFLNKTIIGTSYNFFNEWKEQIETIEEYRDDIVVDCPNEKGLFDETKDELLSIALKSLTKNERLVISFSFEEELSGEEIAEKINIKKNSVYRMRKRILEKLKKFIMEEQKNGRNKNLWFRNKS